MSSSSLLSSESAQSSHAREEARALLQKRLALFFGATFAVYLFVLLSNLGAIALVGAPPGVTPHVARVVFGTHGAVTALLGAIFLACSRGSWSSRALLTFDVAGLLVAVTGSAMSSLAIPSPHDARFSPMVMTIFLVGARASVVPSTTARTLIASLGSAALVAALSMWLPPVPGDSLAFGAYLTFRVLFVGALLAALTSRVIYGLRREIREARRLGQYELLERIGQGGMGVVYRAHHALLRRDTAIKLLHPDRVGEAALQRFEREVRITAGLTSPHTVAIYDYGRSPDGVFYYAMEYLDGGDLEDLVAYTGPLPAGRAVFLLLQACAALREAHRESLVHRDVKSANLLVCARGGEADVVKVLDFGLVKDLAGRSGPALSDVTAITGTPLYMSPEAIRAPETVDARSDLYALGAVGYFLLTGQPVFTGATVVEVCAHHLHSLPRPPSERLGRPVPADLEAVILRCLAKSPADRPESADALADSLRACRDVPPWTPADAASWWEAHGAALRASRDARRAAEAAREAREARERGGAPTSFEVGKTLAVNIDGRRAIEEVP